MLKLVPMKRLSRLTIPSGPCHPVARFILTEMKRANVSYDEVENVAGLLRSTLKEWRKGVRPSIDTAECVLSALGWELVPVAFASSLPAGLRQDLETLLEKYRSSIPSLNLLPAVAARRHDSLAGFAVPATN